MNRNKALQPISQQNDRPFHSKEQSDLTLRTMIGAGKKKKTNPMKTIRMTGKLVTGNPFTMYNGFHNQLHASWKERQKLMKTANELRNCPIISHAVLSQVTQAESDTQGLTGEGGRKTGWRPPDSLLFLANQENLT